MPPKHPFVRLHGSILKIESVLHTVLKLSDTKIGDGNQKGQVYLQSEARAGEKNNNNKTMNGTAGKKAESYGPCGRLIKVGR